MEKVKRFAKRTGYFLAATVVGTVGFLGADYALHSESKFGPWASGMIYGVSAFGYVGLAKKASEV